MPQFIPRPIGIWFYIYLVCGNLMFLLRQERRPWWILRVIGLTVVGILISPFLLTGFHNGNISNVVNFSFAILLTTVMNKVSFKISWSDALFTAIAGYSVQFIHSMFSDTVRKLGLISPEYQYHWKFLFMLVIYYILYLCFARDLKRGQNFDVTRRHLLLLLVTVVLVEIVICYNVRPQWNREDGVLHMICDSVLMIICSILTLTAQFSLMLKRDLEAEVQILTHLRHRDLQQYQISRDTIDLINRKCHDMRYQIRAIGETTHIDPHVVREMEDAVQIYDALAKTGSQPLDIILAEKNLFCQKNGIHISCIADGKRLSFLRESDIYSLFGNLLDNAIQAVMHLPPEQRIVNLSVRAVGELLSVNSYNRYTGTIEMEEGLPVTSTGDLDNHGFGTRSMSKIVQKYGGNISFLARDGIFNVNILFPISPADLDQ